jgi:hypothetical protein
MRQTLPRGGLSISHWKESPCFEQHQIPMRSDWNGTLNESELSFLLGWLIDKAIDSFFLAAGQSESTDWID